MASITETESGVVYLLTSPSGKRYVGQSWDYNERMRCYRCNKGRGQDALHAAIKKYGWDNFTATAIVQGIETQEALDATEDAFIMLLNTLAPNGYNLKRGGMGGKHHVVTKKKMSKSHLGKKHSPETITKQSKAQRGEKNPNFGKSPSAETRAKNSASNLGKPKSEETKLKISATKRGKKREPFSAEWRANMSAAQTVFRAANIEHAMRLLADGKSVREVAKEIGVVRNTIYRWIRFHNGIEAR